MTDIQKVRFNLLGRFEIQFSDQTVDLTEYLPKKILCLLELIILNSDKGLQMAKARRELWADDKKGVDSLKYSIFRLRNCLARIPGLEHVDLIETNVSCYKLSSLYQFEVDVLDFYDLFDELLSADVISQKSFETLTDLYRGPLYEVDYLSVEVESAKLSLLQMLETIVVKYMNQLTIEINIEEKERLLSELIIKVPLSEAIQCCYIRNLVDRRGIKAAIKYSNYIKKRYWNESWQEIDRILTELTSADECINLSEQNDVDGIMEQMSQYDIINHYCCKEVFAYIYKNDHNFSRSTLKEKCLIFLFLPEFKELESKKIVNDTRLAISLNAHKNDVFTKFSDKCYLMMVRRNSYESVEASAKRIVRQIEQRCNISGITYEIKELRASDEQ